jgi:hypothetical protein
MAVSGDDLFHHIPMHIREAEIAAGVAVGEAFVVEAEEVEHRRVSRRAGMDLMKSRAARCSLAGILFARLLSVADAIGRWPEPMRVA